MAKEILTLNGFLGGINKDADKTDLIHQGGMEDEVFLARNIFLDYRGKIILEYPESVANSSGTTSVTTTPIAPVKATATFTFSGLPNDVTRITISDYTGTTVTFEVDDTGDGAWGTYTAINPASSDAAGMATILVSAINTSTLKITATNPSSGVVLLTQDGFGVLGNTTFTLSDRANWDSNCSTNVPEAFTGGVDGFINNNAADKCIVYGGYFYQRQGVYKVGENITYSNHDKYHINEPHAGSIYTKFTADITHQTEGFDVLITPQRQQVTEWIDGVQGKWLDIFISSEAKTSIGSSSKIFGSTTVPRADIVREIYDLQEEPSSSISGSNLAQGSWDSASHSHMGLIGKWMEKQAHSQTTRHSTGGAAVGIRVNPHCCITANVFADHVGSDATYFDNTAESAAVCKEFVSDATVEPEDTDYSTGNTVSVSSIKEFQIWNDGNPSGGELNFSSTTDHMDHFDSSWGYSHLAFIVGKFAAGNASWGDDSAGYVYGPYATNHGSSSFSKEVLPNYIGNKDINIEYKLYHTTGVQSIDVWLWSWTGSNSNPGQQTHVYDATYSGSAIDTRLKQYKLDKIDIIEENGHQDWARHTFKYGSHHAIGGSYDENSISMIVVGFVKTGSTKGPELQPDAKTPIMAIRELSFSEPVTGGWNQDSQYILWQTRLKNDVESLTKRLGVFTAYADKQRITITKPATSGYTGRLYYQLTDPDGNGTGEKFFIADVSTDEGVKQAFSDEWIEFAGSNEEAVFILDQPPSSITYSFNSGYPDDAESINSLYKTSAVVGRQVYIGNCAKFTGYYRLTGGSGPLISFANSPNKIIADQATAADNNWVTNLNSLAAGDILTVTGSALNDGEYTVESISTTTDANDTITVTEALQNESVTSTKTTIEFRNYDAYDGEIILKSGLGKTAGYPDSFYIDLEFGGDTINVMESTGDRLFVFSSNALTVLNIAQDIEFIEATMPQMGVSKHRQVCQVGEGLAFINESGVYYFNGEQWRGLTDEKLNTIAIDADNCAIGYDANRSILHVWIDDQERYYYSLITNAWIGNTYDSSASIPDTNIAMGPKGFAHYEIGGAFKYIGTSNSSSATDRDYQFRTGQITCGSLGQTKKFYKVYVTTNGVGLTSRLRYSIDGSAFQTATTNGVYGQTTNGDQGLLDNATTACKIGGTGKTIEVLLEDIGASNARSDTIFTDISLIFRRKAIK